MGNASKPQKARLVELRWDSPAHQPPHLSLNPLSSPNEVRVLPVASAALDGCWRAHAVHRSGRAGRLRSVPRGATCLAPELTTLAAQSILQGLLFAQAATYHRMQSLGLRDDWRLRVYVGVVFVLGSYVTAKFARLSHLTGCRPACRPPRPCATSGRSQC